MFGAGHTWSKTLLDGIESLITEARVLLGGQGRREFDTKKQVVEDLMSRLIPIQGGAVDEDGEVWHKDMPGDCTFQMLSKHAEGTLLKARGVVIDSTAKQLEEAHIL